ncbi:hypothetical protein BV898_18137 [Hypsibius exemplaris]|uniref:Uncharacterized protein n=1 Tax=Hypsibius exemplaris TaxID=2072580 RepID=A0A9X6NGB6_HYPEX|nr:hypothetical protein BV898_18137 [Hypsibius exemplaris]
MPFRNLYRNFLYSKDKKRMKKEASLAGSQHSHRVCSNSSSQTDFAISEPVLDFNPQSGDVPSENMPTSQSMRMDNGDSDYRLRMSEFRQQAFPQTLSLPELHRLVSSPKVDPVPDRPKSVLSDGLESVILSLESEESDDDDEGREVVKVRADDRADELETSLQQFEMLPEKYRRNRVEAQENVEKMRLMSEKLATAEELCIMLQSNHEAETRTLKATLRKFEEDFESLRRSLEENHLQLQGCEVDRRRLENQVSQLVCERDTLRNLANSTQEELSELRKVPKIEEYFVLRTEKQLVEADNFNLRKDLEESAHSKEVAYTKILELTAENRTLLAKTEQGKLEQRHLQDMSNHLDTANQALNARFEKELRNCVDVFEIYRSKKAHELAQVHKTNDALRNEISQLQLQSQETVSALQQRCAELEQSNVLHAATIRNFQAELSRYRQLLDAAEERQQRAAGTSVQLNC